MAHLLATVFAAAALLARSTTSGAATIYVNTRCGNDAWSGTSSACLPPLGPKATIQSAISAATAGDTILAAPGNYNEVIDLLGKSIVVQSEQGAALTIIDGAGLEGSVVRMATGEGPASQIVGFTITNGTGEMEGSHRVGGGMYISASPTIRNCIIENNHVDWGGGVMIWTGSPVIDSCEFRSNSATGSGGGLVNEGSSAATVIGCLFANNNAGVRGGGALLAGTAAMVNCVFQGNDAALGGGAAIGWGGPDFEGCLFIDNHAEDRGGGCWAAPTATSQFEQCQFSGNQAIEGGGLFAWDSHPWPSVLQFADCVFLANIATVGAGCALVEIDAVAFQHCDFRENTAAIRGGGAHFDRSSPDMVDCMFQLNVAEPNFGEGGAIYLIDGSDPNLQSCVFQQNRAGTGGAVMAFLASSPTIAGGAFDSNVARYGGAVAGLIGCDLQLNGVSLTGNSASIEGGAMWLRQSTSDLQECELTANWGESGGGIVARESHLAMADTNLTSNTAHLYGGGLFGEDGSTVELIDCNLFSNVATYQSGGGVIWFDCDGGEPALVASGCVFHDNQGSNPAVSLGSNCLAEFTSCMVSSNANSTGISGGAIGGGSAAFDKTTFVGNFGYGAFAYGNLEYTFEHCLFNDGISGHGQLRAQSCTFQNGSIDIRSDGVAQVSGCSFIGSPAMSFGGELVLTDSVMQNSGSDVVYVEGRAKISNCRITGANWGIRVFRADEPVLIANCVIANCTIGVIRVFSGDDVRLVNTTIANCPTSINVSGAAPQVYAVNCILQGVVAGPLSAITIDFSNVVNGWSGPGRGNIFSDPLFEDPAAGDFHLRPQSPCVDAGNNWGVNADVFDLDGDGDVAEFAPLDLDRAPRFVGINSNPAGCGVPVVVDMGALEHQGGASGQPALGDLTGDGVVSIDDLLELVSLWGNCRPCCPGDINIDGVVDIDDLLVLVAHWTT